MTTAPMTTTATTPIIDVHCGWGATSAAPNWNDMVAVQSAMKARGIGLAFISSVLARRYDLPAGNEALSELVLTPPVSGESDVRGWYVIHPARAQECIQQMRRFLYHPRFIGAALYADPQTGMPVSVTDAHDLITAFRRYGKPLLVETPNAAAMAEAIRIADDLPGVKIIASGMGGDEWREAVVIAARPMNLYLDISGALVPEKIEHAIQILHGTRKLLFASGAPFTDPAAVLGLLDDVDLTAEDRYRILFGNAERLFNLNAPAVVPTGDAEPEGQANFLVGNVPETTQSAPTLGALGSLGSIGGGETTENPG